MHDTQHAGRLGLLTEPRRNKYFYGKLLDVAHLQMEQSYFNRTRWLLNRLSLGEGVLCGLDVKLRDGQLCVTRGVAIDKFGREVVVPATVCINPWKPTDDCGRAEPELSPDESYDAYLCLEYRECPADFMPILATECDTREQCAAGTIVESFRLSIDVIREGDPPPPSAGPGPQICPALRGGEAADKIEELCHALSDVACETPTTSASCVTLARIKLNARDSEDADPTIGEIEVCSVRPMAYSNALLFDMILCLAQRMDECCAPANPVVTKIWPENGATLTNESDLNRLLSPNDGLKLTFDRKMEGAKLDAPDPWLGLWLVITPAATPAVPDPSATAVRLKLTPVGSTPTPPSSKMNYALSTGGGTTTTTIFSSAHRPPVGTVSTQGEDTALLLAIRADVTSITDTSGKLLDADFAGTGLDFAAIGVSPDFPAKTLAEALWDMNPGDSLTFDATQFSKKLLPATPAALPSKGSGDGSPGGLFHSAFKVIPQSP